MMEAGPEVGRKPVAATWISLRAHNSAHVRKPAAGSAASGARSWLFAIARVLNRLALFCRNEPLVHFLALGLVLFVFMQASGRQHDPHRIEVTRAHVAQLERNFALQFGRPPDPTTLEALVQRDIHDEILVREGLLLHLDKGDEIVRRRVVQKEQFLLDANAPQEPSTEQVKAYYLANAARYGAPASVTFSHIYFAIGPDGEQAAGQRARQALASLSDATERAPDRGDAFPDLYDFSSYDQEQVARLFGHTQLADAVFTAPLSHWSGPFRSAYGVHLIRVSARTTAAVRPFAEARDEVRADWLRDAQDRASAAAFDTLARRFVVVRKDGRATR
jgi:peptidyl-prolyl cis-trans isomerase C